MMEASATATERLVLYGAMKVADFDGLNSLGRIPVKDGSWIPLRENPEAAMDRAAKDLPDGEDPRLVLILYRVRFTGHGVSHYSEKSILWKHGGLTWYPRSLYPRLRSLYPRLRRSG